MFNKRLRALTRLILAALPLLAVTACTDQARRAEQTQQSGTAGQTSANDPTRFNDSLMSPNGVLPSPSLRPGGVDQSAGTAGVPKDSPNSGYGTSVIPPGSTGSSPPPGSGSTTPGASGTGTTGSSSDGNGR